MRLILLPLLFFCCLSTHAASEMDNKPSATETTVATETPQPDQGQATYEQFCIICHQDGVASAPKFRNESDWKPRLAGRTIEDLVKSATKGLNLMPEKGTCSDCSEDDLKAAIQYMLPKP